MMSMTDGKQVSKHFHYENVFYLIADFLNISLLSGMHFFKSNCQNFKGQLAIAFYSSYFSHDLVQK